jgi:prepilin-type N-terminal cleavage/methylation domain-containing protein
MITLNHRGYTFLELLMALSIFSIGLLGVLQLQMQGSRQLHESVYISRAAMQAYNLSAAWTMFDAAPGSALANDLMDTWNKTNAVLLPQGEGSFIISGNEGMITVTWDFAAEYVTLYQIL